MPAVNPEAPRIPSRDGDAATTYAANRIAHWDAVARTYPNPSAGRSYHRRLEHVYKFLIPPGLRVLELGCGAGSLLAALSPAEGVGVDFSSVMLDEARRRHPGQRFVLADAHDLSVVEGTYDAIVISDLLHDVWDVQKLLSGVHGLCHPGTRIVIAAR